MELTLTPELEARIQQELDRGGFHSPMDVIEGALDHLAAMEEKRMPLWNELAAKLEESFAAAERGETASAEELDVKLDSLAPIFAEMTAYRITTPAQQDLFKILNYLAEEATPSIALRYDDEFRAAFRLLAKTPGLGHRRRDLTDKHVLFYTVQPYLIVFEIRPECVLIHAVIHGSRDFPAILGRRKL